jgi:hypothetical protein
MIIKIFEDFQSIRSLRIEWNRIVKNRDLDISATFEWNNILWESHLSRKNLKIIMVLDQGELAGIFPVFLKKKTFKKIQINTISFLSNLSHVHNDLILMDNACLSFLLNQLHRIYRDAPWNIIEIPNVIIESPTYMHLNHVLRTQHYKFIYTQGISSPQIRCKGMDWEEYLQGRTKNLKKNFKRKINKLSNNNGFQIISITQSNKMWGILSSIETQSWKFKEGSSILDKQFQRKFYKLFFDKFYHSIKFFVLFFNEIPISYSLGVIHNNKYLSLKTSFDQRYEKVSPGIGLKLHILKYCFDNNLDLFDFCGEDETHKLDFTKVVSRHLNYFVFNTDKKSNLLYYLNYIENVIQDAFKKRP